MGFMDEYRKALEDEQKKKKKKTAKESVQQKADFMQSYRSNLSQMDVAEDVAPILPTASTKKSEKRTWFDMGAFDDGYQFGDVTKTILGTTTDVLENVGAGIANMGESALDALAWLGNANARGQYYANGGGYNIEQDKLFEEQHKAATKGVQEFIKKDLYDGEKVAKAIISNPMKALTGIDADTDSVFGEKSDSLIQSGGQLLATAGLQAVGVPWFLTTGATSFGSEAENALNNGADFSEAGASATISAGAEILSEMLSGGIKFGGKTVDDALLKPFIRGISNKTARLLANAGIDAVGEGGEELVSGLFSAIGQKLTYMDEAELGELFTKEEAMESFLGGMVLGGIGNVVQGVKAEKNGVDAVTGLTDNEQMVVDKIVNDRISEKENVTWREKNKIYDQVMHDLEKGYISTDDIESVLSGDSFKSWQQHTDTENMLQSEIEKLENMPNAEITVKQSEQLKRLREELDNHRAQFDTKGFKAILSEKTRNAVQGTRLAESYNEQARRGQTFEADLSQYDEKQKAVIQKAIDSGILNNTNRTHEFVDMIAKISADKGVLFDFSNNAKLKESGFAVEGKQVNGFVTKDGITLNIDSPKALQSTVGHEITHVLEGTEFYNELKTTIFDYAKSKGEYDSRLATLTELYKDVDADVEAELAADLVGDYLFQDYDFVSHLSSANRNVFQKIYDEIKYLYKVATAGSKEARELEKVKRAFEKAYRGNGKAKGDTKYSLTDSDGVNLSKEQQEFFRDSKARDSNGNLLKVYHGTPRGGFNEFMHSEIGTTSDYGYFGRGFYFTTAERVAKYYAGYLNSSEVKTGYVNVTNPYIIPTKRDIAFTLESIMGHRFDGPDANYERSVAFTEWLKDNGYDGVICKDEIMVLDSNQFKNADNTSPTKSPDIRYSLSDSDGKQLTKEQQEYFKDSKMRDENGNLKVMYHGSRSAGFHVFDPNMSDDGASFFFVDSPDVAASYSGTSETYEAKTLRSAEDFSSLFEEIEADGVYEVKEENGKFVLYDTGDAVAESDTAQGLYEEWTDYSGVGYGPANYKAYLNLVNPLVVDADGNDWNRLPGIGDSAKYEYIKIVEVGDAPGQVTVEYAVSGDNAPVTETVDLYKKFPEGVADALSDMAPGESVEGIYANPATTREYAQYAKEQGYDGVIFNNIYDIGAYGSNGATEATVAIAFDSNQIKSVANEKPTADKDIRYSLSDSEGESVKVMDGGTVARYSLSTWTPETQENVRANLVKAGYEKERVDKWIKDTNSVAATIAADRDRLDFVAADNQTMLKNNQEYVKTLDASTLCAKRLLYQGTFDAIQHRMPNTMLSSDDLIELLNMMKKHKVETPCSVCYVESRRRHLGKFAQEWLDSYKGEYKPNLDEVTTSDGLEALRKSHPDTYEDFINAMNKKGSSNPKVVQLRTEYRNEIMSLTPAQIRKIESIGGLRVQSFSDFETPHLLDMMQAVMDMSAKGLSSQAYTKVPNFAWVFGDTGIKINLSLIAEGDGFDADGNLAFSSVEGMDFDEAMKLRDAYSKNVGTIIVGANDKHILACMADDRIDFIIPFHRSGWGQKELSMMGMGSYDDYTYGQSEHDLNKPTKVVGGVQQYAGVGNNLYPPDYWDYSLSGKENAERYLNLCANTGREPKFSKFLVNNGDGSYSLQPDGSTDGYWKTLIDFKMYDNEGNGAAQQKVQPNFNMAEANRVLSEYKGGANSLPVANEVVEEFIAKHTAQDLAPAMSLSNIGEKHKEYGRWNVYGKDIKLDIAPVAEPVAETVSNTESVAPEVFPEVGPVAEEPQEETVETVPETPVDVEDRPVLKRLNNKLSNSNTELSNVQKLREDSIRSFDEKIAKAKAELDSKKNKDTKVANNLKRRIERLERLKADVDAEYAKRIANIEARVTRTEADIQKYHPGLDRLEKALARIDRGLELDKAALTEEYNQKREQFADKNTYISKAASELYNEIQDLKKGVKASKQLGYLLDHGYEWKSIRTALINIKHHPGETVNFNSEAESVAREMLNESFENGLIDLEIDHQKQMNELEAEADKRRKEAREAEQRIKRKDLHQGIIDRIKGAFQARGFDLDTVLKNAKDLSTFATVDNTPQRVMEKSLGYKEGQILGDLTVNQVAQNETKGIVWLNKQIETIKKISKQYSIKPGSKESAAAQMYAEGFYVGENNDIISYGDAELAKDFPDVRVQANIKALAKDDRIRQIYDETLAAINEARTRNAYPEIPRLDNYFLHFRAMEDTFSRLGLPFNPNDIRAKDLPTDLNGVTADLKPGQPYFASAMHRKGKRTSFDLLGGLERYLSSAKNQIYHIDDIQTLRALRDYIADTYGQAHGLENLDELSDVEAQERIKEVFGSHLSTFAKFLNEEANVIAGKTALIDRGLEGIIGRRGITLLDTLNKQVGSNMVGLNVSSSLTNILPVVQTFAKTNKADFVKAFSQTVANKLPGRNDGFAEHSPVMIRRKGADRFHRTPWQKAADAGYVFMSAVDDVSTELIARTKYNELTRNGMDSETAHRETDKWVSRLMGDRSLGQQPQMYNSKMLGLLTKFQLEVRNQLDSQFYDTIQEAKVSNEHIENEKLRNAKTAAKVTSTLFQLAVAQHLFGQAFESVAGYNPAFDIIEVLMTAFGFDDDEESEDTVVDNLEQALLAFAEDLPYASTFLEGGRIPISSALPVEELVKGEDKWGNEKSRWKTLAEVAPYYALPTGYGQIKKSVQGLGMFSDDHPIAGSYTESGNLRFPVEDTLESMFKAGIFGQYASENARKYFDEGHKTLNPDQTAIFAELDIPIEEYWEYKDNLDKFYDVKDKFAEAAKAKDATDEDIIKSRYYSAVYGDLNDLYAKQKEIVSGNSFNKQGKLRSLQEQMNTLLANSKHATDKVYVSGNYATVGGRRFNYDAEDKWWYEIKETNSDGEENMYYEMEQKVTKGLGISYEQYWSNRKEYNYAYEHPEKYQVARAVGGYSAFKSYTSELYDIHADKDENGKTINGSRKEKVIDYINNLDADYGEKIILFRSEYPGDDTYNADIVDYLNGRDDISYEEMATILKELGFEVTADGRVYW